MRESVEVTDLEPAPEDAILLLEDVLVGAFTRLFLEPFVLTPLLLPLMPPLYTLLVLRARYSLP